MSTYTTFSLNKISWITTFTCIFFILHPTKSVNGCYESIISFGDSLADTGNLLHLHQKSNKTSHFGELPYGETFFGHPTGRFSDGRLVIDFIAERLGLPLVQPYVGLNYKVESSKSVNFAVAGATALDFEYLLEKGVRNPTTTVSLGTQMNWFREMLDSLYTTPSERKKFLENSLIVVGEIGGDDFNHAFLGNSTREEVESYVPAVINTISSVIQELMKLGATTLLVPGDLPIGCSTAYLTRFMHSKKDDYDPKTGCINWLNDFSQSYNEQLEKELHHLRESHPYATIIYADYYNVAMQFYSSPKSKGFMDGALVACCGGGGPYNYNSSGLCGDPLATNICSDPSLYVSWDGMHFTEAAYKLIATGLLQGTYSSPRMSRICTLLNPNVGDFDSHGFSFS